MKIDKIDSVARDPLNQLKKNKPSPSIKTITHETHKPSPSIKTKTQTVPPSIVGRGRRWRPTDGSATRQRSPNLSIQGDLWPDSHPNA
jgi:hypothetical protein